MDDHVASVAAPPVQNEPTSKTQRPDRLAAIEDSLRRIEAFHARLEPLIGLAESWSKLRGVKLPGMFGGGRG